MAVVVVTSDKVSTFTVHYDPLGFAIVRYYWERQKKQSGARFAICGQKLLPAANNLLMSTDLQQTEVSRLAVSAADLAKKLGISERHLWAMHADGRLGPEPIALGRAKRWSVEEIQRWLAAGGPPRADWKRAPSSPIPG